MWIVIGVKESEASCVRLSNMFNVQWVTKINDTEYYYSTFDRTDCGVELFSSIAGLIVLNTQNVYFECDSFVGARGIKLENGILHPIVVNYKTKQDIWICVGKRQ